MVVLWSRVLLTFRGHVTSLHGNMTWIPHRPFPIGGPLERSLSLTVSEIFNGECDAVVDVTLIRPLNKVKVHWPSSLVFCTHKTARTRTKYGDRSFAVQGPRIYNSLPAELRAPDGFRDI